MITTTQQDEYWYLSFVERYGPNPRWLGATVVKADSGIDAVREARRHGCNPGGEVLMKGLEPGREVPDGILNRLVETEDELQAILGKTVHVKNDELPKCMACESEAKS